MRILIVDDSTFALNVLLKELKAIGIDEDQIEKADSGAVALEKIASQTFDLIILDIVMSGIDGIDVLKNVKQVQPDAKIVMCSGSSSHEIITELISLGIHAFLVKPFNSEDFSKAVRRILFGMRKGCLVAKCHVCGNEMIEVDFVNAVSFFCPKHCMQIGPLLKALANQDELDKDYRKATE